jgi:hypothetical protein
MDKELEPIRYSVMTKNGKVKSYVDKRWCYCAAHAGPHMHPKGERRDGK